MDRDGIRLKIASGATIVDVRTAGEFGEGAYPGALNIPLDELAARLAELGPKDGPVILYCASGARSARAARILSKAGFSDLCDAGGLRHMPR